MIRNRVSWERIRNRMTGVAMASVSYLSASAQSDSTKPSPLQFSGYAEVYYAYDFNKPGGNELPPVYYNFNRHNEVNVNLAFARAAWQSGNLRANLALGFGTYINANYAAEKGTLKNLFEANAGVKLSRRHNFWLDAGIMPSHIGFESAVGKDNWTLTRSLVAEQSPYFESGARLSYTTASGDWYLAALLLNGWQRISRPPGNSAPAGGTQVTWKPAPSVTLNYSTFIGSDTPDSVRRWRYYQNFYAILQLGSLIGLTAGIDYGLQQKERHSTTLLDWYTPVAILRLTPGSHWAFAARGEYFSDPGNIIVGEHAPAGFRSYGYSLNADYKPAGNIMIRIEVKQLSSPDAVFLKADESATSRFQVITASMAISL